MTDRVATGNLRVAKVLYDFVNDEALPGTGVEPDAFWAGVDQLLADLAPRNRELLARRDDLQAQLDKWHRHRVIGADRPGPATRSSSPRSAICNPNPSRSP